MSWSALPDNDSAAGKKLTMQLKTTTMLRTNSASEPNNPNHEANAGFPTVTGAAVDVVCGNAGALSSRIGVAVLALVEDEEELVVSIDLVCNRW